MRNSELRTQNSELRYDFLFTVCALCSVLFILSFGMAFASEEAAHGEHGFAWKDLLWPVINFAVLVFVLVWFITKPAKEFFKSRAQMVEKSMKDAEDARILAEKTLGEVRSRLEKTGSEIEGMLEAARKSGEKEKHAIIAEGEKMKIRILEQTKSNIEFELQKARETIKSEAALLALELAEKNIKEKLDQKGHERLLDEYINKLSHKS